MFRKANDVSRRKTDKSRGAALMELALVLPALILLTFGGVAVLRGASNQAFATRATYEAAIYYTLMASLGNYDIAAVDKMVADAMQAQANSDRLLGTPDTTSFETSRVVTFPTGFDVDPVKITSSFRFRSTIPGLNQVSGSAFIPITTSSDAVSEADDFQSSSDTGVTMVSRDCCGEVGFSPASCVDPTTRLWQCADSTAAFYQP